jgi:hypothetical protein
MFDSGSKIHIATKTGRSSPITGQSRRMMYPVHTLSSSSRFLYVMHPLDLVVTVQSHTQGLGLG